MANPSANRDETRLDLVGLDRLFADAVWSNGTMEPFCLACRAEATKAVEMMLPTETICAHCGQRLDGEQP